MTYRQRDGFRYLILLPIGYIVYQLDNLVAVEQVDVPVRIAMHRKMQHSKTAVNAIWVVHVSMCTDIRDMVHSLEHQLKDDDTKNIFTIICIKRLIKVCPQSSYLHDNM